MNLFDFNIPEWFWVCFNLLVLVLILKKILWDKVQKILDERQEIAVKAGLDATECERLRSESQELRAKLDDDLKNQAMEMTQSARSSAGKEYDRIIAEAEEKSALIVSAAKVKANREREVILSLAKDEIVTTAINAAGLLLRANVDNEKNDLLIREMLEKRSA